MSTDLSLVPLKALVLELAARSEASLICLKDRETHLASFIAEGPKETLHYLMFCLIATLLRDVEIDDLTVTGDE